MDRRAAPLVVLLPLMLFAVALARAQQPAWTAPQEPFRIWGNTYYVGTRGLSSILIASGEGHVLIDVPMAENVGRIAANIRTLGFRVEDIDVILNTHAHFDHAGGTAEMQRLSGARVAARPASARVLMDGRSGRDDPQFGAVGSMPPVGNVRSLADGERLNVGPIVLTAHATGGHTPGGTSWSWRSCDGARCADLVYADSLTPVSADGFLFSKSGTYPTALQDFERGFATLAALPCDILLTPHPEASNLWDRLARRDRGGQADALRDTTACRRYVELARERLRMRLETEAAVQ